MSDSRFHTFYKLGGKKSGEQAEDWQTPSTNTLPSFLARFAFGDIS